MAVELFIYKMGDFMESAQVIRWLVSEGDQVEQHQPVMEIMTDKVTAELESPASGVLKGIRKGVTAGAVVPVGELIAFIAKPEESVPVLPPLPTTGQAEPTVVQHEVSVAREASRVRATPIARRIAKELGVDLGQVKGAGPEGRIREEDVRTHAQTVKAGHVSAPAMAGYVVDHAPPAAAPGRVLPATPVIAPEDRYLVLTPVQRVTGRRMTVSFQTVPQFTLTANVDMTNALELRNVQSEILQPDGRPPSITCILVKAVAAALKSYPRGNCSFAGDGLILHGRVNVNVAIGTHDGLVAPVIRDADRKSLADLERELSAYQDKAREMRFTVEDLSDGTFTVSNLGMYEVDRFDAIINPPQSAILATGRIVPTPIGTPDGSVVLHPILAMSLTVDHRAMDGVHGATLLTEIKRHLEQPLLLI